MSNQPASTQNNTWVLVLAACAAGWFLSSYINKKPVDVVPDVVPVVSVESVVKKVLQAQAQGNAAAFALAADKVDAKEIKTDRELLEFLESTTKQARLDANKPFDVMVEASIPDVFAGQEAEVSKFLRKVAKSW